MRCGYSAEKMSNHFHSTRPSDTSASLSGPRHTRLAAVLRPTAKESGFQRCTLATTPPTATSSEERCTSKVLVALPAPKPPLALPPTPASVPQAVLQITGHHLPRIQQPRDDQRGGQREGQPGEPPQQGGARPEGRQQQGDRQGS